MDLWGKSLSQHLSFRAAGKRQSFHLYWSDLNEELSEQLIQVWRLYLILPFVSSSWVDCWPRRTFIKPILISAGNTGIWEPKFYYQWSYLELVGVSLSFENLNFPCLKGLLWKCMPGSLEHTDWFFLLHSEPNVFTGYASHRLWEGMLPVFRNQKLTTLFLLFHVTCCALSPNSVLKKYKILFHGYSTK